MMIRSAIFLGLVLVCIGGCSKSAVEITELRNFPMDSLEGLIAGGGIQLDEQISSDGHGSVRISVTEPTTIRLYELADVEVENARLVYQAKLRTENVTGQVYLEMLCHFPGKGEFFSRGLQNSMTGTTGWSSEETPFMLNSGEKPDIIKLNLVIDGSGTVWIDDIRLLKATL